MLQDRATSNLHGAKKPVAGAGQSQGGRNGAPAFSGMSRPLRNCIDHTFCSLTGRQNDHAQGMHLANGPIIVCPTFGSCVGRVAIR